MSVALLRSEPDNIYQTALEALYNGINVLPIAGNGSKRPPIRWEQYQHDRVILRDLQRWFLSGYPGLAFVTGAISQNLEVLDFDTREVYQSWRAQMRVRGLDALAERLAQGYLEASPQGIHLPYRCRLVEGNQKLAGREPEPNQRKTLIETRGNGGIIVVAPSAGGVHPSGRAYELLQGSIGTIQRLTVPERQVLLEAARSLDELPPPECWEPRPSTTPLYGDAGELPGHIFNRQASWEDVLGPYGWRLLKECEGEGYWTKNIDVHATTNYRGNNLFYVFSTATVFESQRGYSKFAAYTLLRYGRLNDTAFAAAAKELANLGYR